MPRRFRNPCSYLPRRLQIVASLTALLLFCIIFIGSSGSDSEILAKVPYGPKLEKGAQEVVAHLPKLPDSVNNPSWMNAFRHAHTPPAEQTNSRSGDTRWFADFKWKNPFSSSITLDEERAVLPPLLLRPPIYTYFDPTGRRKDDKSKHAEQQLLQVWRRAWWAKGFKPIILGPSEAMNNDLYRRVNSLEINNAELKHELMRWLAWGSMGGGILSHWLTVPMAAHDEVLLGFLRSGEYPDVVRYKGLGTGLYVGDKAEVAKVTQAALVAKDYTDAASVHDLVEGDLIKVDDKHAGVAYYSSEIISEKYAELDKKLKNEETRADGMSLMPLLINAHLQSTWQSTFSKGIAVLKPIPKSTTPLIGPIIELARTLAQCADTPMPASCPPNIPHCKPCVSSPPMPITIPQAHTNSSDLFTISAVPHPLTLQSLVHLKNDLTLKFVRRKTERDSWIIAVTRRLLGRGKSSYARLGPLKDLVGSDIGSSRSLWLIAEEQPSWKDNKDLYNLDWALGYEIPRATSDQGKSETSVPLPDRRPPAPEEEFDDESRPSQSVLEAQQHIFQESIRFIMEDSTDKKNEAAVRKREMVEAWNLADTEAWKFVRAYQARRIVEQQHWEKEEKSFLGKGLYDRWKDTLS